MTADEAINECIRILEESPTYHQHSHPCYCEMCSYVRGNITEMRALQQRLRSEAEVIELPRFGPRRVTPRHDDDFEREV